ncbi:hypothetical protein IMCC9480_119 [Oxalobacteraceae bacterium IMCC9480]|nr:hypothetical protein IMCC9480_119 [Oxalobacteraceae bacterium IMCC9480]
MLGEMTGDQEDFMNLFYSMEEHDQHAVFKLMLEFSENVH